VFTIFNFDSKGELMMTDEILKDLIVENDTKIVFFIMDGLGGLPDEKTGKTELETANTPNLDRLAAESVCGLLDPVLPGITPGSGPGHMALFGYDPLKYNIGRGVLSALGIDFPIQNGDLCARANFATIDSTGSVTDRRAGRISTEENERICKKLRDNIKLDVKYFVQTESEHRAAVVFRGDGLSEAVKDTDPQQTGVLPLNPEPVSATGEKTTSLLRDFLAQAKDILKDEKRANMILLRGFAEFREYPSMKSRYGLKSGAIAMYPMYRGISRLLGMDVFEKPESDQDGIRLLKKYYNDYDFFFFHIKKTDSYGEDGNFDAKVKKIEEVDSIVAEIAEINPDVLVVTADHSTPANLKNHSWHPVPVIFKSKYIRRDSVTKFGEKECIVGELGRMPTKYLVQLALANTLRLKKFGA